MSGLTRDLRRRAKAREPEPEPPRPCLPLRESVAVSFGKLMKAHKVKVDGDVLSFSVGNGRGFYPDDFYIRPEHWDDPGTPTEGYGPSEGWSWVLYHNVIDPAQRGRTSVGTYLRYRDEVGASAKDRERTAKEVYEAVVEGVERLRR